MIGGFQNDLQSTSWRTFTNDKRYQQLQVQMRQVIFISTLGSASVSLLCSSQRSTTWWSQHLCRRVCLKWRVYKPLGASFFDDVPLVAFMYLVFTRTPVGVTVDDSGLCCCVPCLSSAIISICLLILHAITTQKCKY